MLRPAFRHSLAARAAFAAAAAASLTLAAGCTINPVTGERQLALVSAAEEVALGEAHYFPTRQAQGGDFVVDPALGAYVAGVGQRVAAVSNRALPYEFVVLNSSVPNAWALPGGKIAINRGLLLELGSEAELAAVLSHEVVHAAARHGALAMQRGMLMEGALTAVTLGMQRGNYSELVVGTASIGAQLIAQRYSRGAELESDLYGTRYMAEAGYDPTAAVTLQETFVRLSEGRGSEGWLAGLFASHPPSVERVERNRATAASLPRTGELGRERYQAAIASLLETRPAYDAYDAGRAALADGRTDEADQRADEALRLFPSESHFHALKGDVAFARGRHDEAIVHFRAALSRNGEFFYYPLRKGLAHLQLRQWDAAEADLERSATILPTADAFHGLGLIAEQRGDRLTALEHYAAASQSQSPAGQAARRAIVRLDLPANPERYLSVRSTLDAQEQLLIEIGNTTDVALAEVTLSVRYAGPNGAQRESHYGVARIEPGAAQRIATGLVAGSGAQGYVIAVTSARVPE